MRGQLISGTTASFLTEGPAILYWLLLSLVAILLDLTAGGFLSGRIPNIGRLIGNIARRIAIKLDRQERSNSALRMRGLFVLCAGVPIFVVLGLLANVATYGTAAGTAVGLLALTPILGQKKAWLDHIDAGKKIASDKSVTDPHALAQTSTQAVVLQFGLSFFPGVLLFTAGGFAALFPYCFLRGLVQSSVPGSKNRGHFYQSITWLHELVTFPITIVASVLLTIAHFFFPATHIGSFLKLSTNNTQTLASHFMPLNIVASGLGLSFNRTQKSDGKPSSAGKWIGPEDGRAKLTTNDMRKVWLVVLVAFGLSLILLILLFLFVAVRSSNGL